MKKYHQKLTKYIKKSKTSKSSDICISNGFSNDIFFCHEWSKGLV